MTRFGAFAIHLGISLVIFAVLAYLVLFSWYPDLFFATDGGWQGMRIIILVDLVLGPLLTLIVFKAGKPGLKFDLSAIATFQAICLVAGVWLVYSERPLAIIYADGQFSSVSRGSYINSGLPVPDFEAFPGAGPKWIMIDMPDDLEGEAELRRQMIAQGQILEFAVDRYVPFDANAARFRKEAVEADKLLSDETASEALLFGWLQEHGGDVEDYRFYPYGSRYSYLFLGYRADTSELVGILDTPMTI